MKACVRRQKNDAADAAAICEAVTRPTMRLVAIKSAELWIGPLIADGLSSRL